MPPLNLWYPKAQASAPPIASSVSVHGPVCLPALALKIQDSDWLLHRPKTSEHNRARSLPSTQVFSPGSAKL